MARLEGSVFVGDPPAQCKPTRAQYLNKQVTFEAYYRAIAVDAGVSFHHAPQEFLLRCKQALDEGDEAREDSQSPKEAPKGPEKRAAKKN